MEQQVNNDNFNERMESFLTHMGDSEEKISDNLLECKEEIISISNYCKTTGMYERALEQSKCEFKEKSAKELYMWMVERIAHAPTYVHVKSVVLIFMPRIAELV